MAIKNTSTSYGSVSKFLHWLIFLMVLTLLIVGMTMEDIGDKQTKMQVYTLHKSFGLTVLLLAVIRLIWALSNPKPGYPSTTPRWQQTAARALHHLLYLLLLAMPLSGWIMSTASGHTPQYFNWFALPMPGIPEQKTLADIFALVHTILAWTIITTVSLHIGAAIKHHFIDKDNILKRMLPGHWE